MSPRPGDHARAALGLLIALGACTPDPSFQLSWSLVDDPSMTDGTVPDRALVCSEVGVAEIELATLASATGESVDVRTFPCFPSTGLPVDGPVLEPGSYTLLVSGLRRNGEPWACEAEDELCYAFNVVDIEVDDEGKIASADGLQELSEGLLTVPLLAPLPCDDGIDNDADGRVDDRDPGCFDRLENDVLVPFELRTEGDEAGLTLFQTTVSLLYSDIGVVEPTNLDIRSFELGYRVEADGPITPIARVNRQFIEYRRHPFALPLIDDRDDPFEPGIPYRLTMTALDSSDAAMTTPIERDSGQPFELDPDQPSGYFLGNFVFTPDTFLEPVVQKFAFLPDLLLSVTDEVNNACELNGLDQSLDRVWIRVTDHDAGAELSLAELGLSGVVAAVDEADGWVSFDCPAAVVTSQALNWGKYSVEIEGRIGAEVCFATSDAAEDTAYLAPQVGANAQIISLERQFALDGLAVCPECADDSGCDGSRVCDKDTGLCVPKDPTSG